MNDWLHLLERTYDEVRRPVAQLDDTTFDRPTPCTEWTVRDLFEHVVGAIDMFATAAGGRAPDSAADVAPLARFNAAVQNNLAAWRALDDPAETLSLSYGDFPAAVAAGMNQMDALIHSWDLAAALGLTLQWPTDVAEAAMRTADVRFRTRPRGAAFGPEVPARDGTTQERLLALSGRDTLPWCATASPSASVKHVYAKLPAQDAERARRFYEEKLGLSPFAEVHGHLYYEVDGAHFLLFPSAGRPSGTHDQLGLVVEDLGAEMTRLRKAGVVFESYEPPDVPVPLRENVMDMGAMKAAWIKDSEGNLLSLNEFVGPSAFDR